jgi:hypothetical protein
MPLAFVLCNLTATVYEFATSRDPSNLAPAIPETTFLLIYSLFAVSRNRARSRTRLKHYLRPGKNPFLPRRIL